MSAPSPANDGAAGATKKRFRIRSNYFCEGDLVWVRPAKLPFWPAEVIECDEATNRVRARLLHAPAAEVLAPNLLEEQRKQSQLAKKAEARLRKQQKKEGNPGDDSATAVVSPPPSVEADVVTASGLVVHFFDKLRTTEELETCIEDRLQRTTHTVDAYEAAFTRAVMQANRLVRIPLSPEKLLPYEVCAVGIVHSLMRAQIAAPRQPNTGTFDPQTALIRLRGGLENAARDLQGFEFIWVLFQFSFAAPMASGEGQESVRLLKASQKADATPTTQQSPPSSSSPTAPTAAADAVVAPVKSSDAVEAGVDLDVVLSTFRRRQGFDRSAGFKTMIIPPRDEEWRGVFATRSPHRPNFIGISCVRLVAVHGLDIHIADHDLLHGTPVLDIKPYLPFCDAHPDARAGWVGELEASGKGKGDHKYDKQMNMVDRIPKTE